MVSSSKRKADDLGAAVNGPGSKRIRTTTPPKVNGSVNGKFSCPGPDNTIAPRPPPSGSSKRKLAKHERRKLHQEQGRRQRKASAVNGKPDQQEASGEETETSEGQGGARSRKAGIKQSVKWEMTHPIGGALADLDPIFSHDEMYYLLAYDTTMRVYSVSTKLLVRTLPCHQKGYITGSSISLEEPSQLWVSLSTGYIEQWDWQEGTRMKTFQTGYAIASLTHSTRGSQGLIYSIERSKKHWSIVAHRLKTGESKEKSELHTLYRSKASISHIQVLDQGRVIVATAGKRIVLGFIRSKRTDLEYTWRELECPEWITCLDVRLSEGEAENERKPRKGTKADSDSPPPVDIVVGGLQGSLWVYRDLLRKFVDNEKGKGAGTAVPERLHWHRTGVGAVRWVLDGNYLISGGSETVLLRWQLDTGKWTKLPHLSAPIESIVLSFSERLYGVRFANNTAMVLFSAELEPILTVPGPRIRPRRQALIQPPNITYVSSQAKNMQPFQSTTRPVAIVIPDPGRLLLAVPEASPSRTGFPTSSSKPLLQTLDVDDSSQLTLQALTRTNTTTKIMGPEANIIAEPNVVLLQASHDGRWLATVDEWVPPSTDFERVSFDESDLIRQQMSHMEVNLKIWSRSAKTETWELVARIEDPHRREDDGSPAPERVLDLIPDPLSLGFVSIGTDATVKVWRAKHRIRDGRQVLAQDGAPLTTWYCECLLRLPIAVAPNLSNMQPNVVGRLACSPDGSVIAVAYQEHSGSVSCLYLLSTSPLEMRSFLPDLVTSNLNAIALLSRYLILLSKTLQVYDVVNSSTLFVYSTASAAGLGDMDIFGSTHLAIDHTTNTFAIVTPERKNPGEELRSQVAIFDPTLQEPLFTTDYKVGTVALLPLDGLESTGKGGYVILDSAAHIRQVKPKAKELAVTRHKAPKAMEKRRAGLEGLFGARGDGNKALVAFDGSNNGLNETAAEEVDLDDDETPFVKPHELNEALDGGSLYNLPRVDNLFAQVAGLYISRPTD